MKSKRSGLITLQEISVQTGVSVSALNYYANLELLRVADRQGNTRLLSKVETIRRVKEIQRLRREGYPLRVIRAHLGGAPTP